MPIRKQRALCVLTLRSVVDDNNCKILYVTEGYTLYIITQLWKMILFEYVCPTELYYTLQKINDETY